MSWAPNTQISLEERRKIERWRHARVAVDEMARVLNRHRSTIRADGLSTAFCLMDKAQIQSVPGAHELVFGEPIPA